MEEGQRYIEKTVSKHSEMVESIRELSDGLMQLEAKLKVKKKEYNGEKADASCFLPYPIDILDNI